MKKKSIIILSTIAFLVVVGIIVTIVCVSSSNSIAKKMKKATESVKNVTKVTTVYSVKDGEELVYNNEQVVSIDETGTADVVTNESKLNSKFVLETIKLHFFTAFFIGRRKIRCKASVNTIENFNRDNLIGLNLTKKLVTNYKKTKTGFECEVTKENINAVLGTEDFEILDNAKIVFVFENKNLVSIECVFKTTSSKDVTIYTTYTY